MIYRLFSFTQLNKKRIFELRRIVGSSSFYIRENVYELCFLFRNKNKISFLNSFASKKFHISYYLSVSKVIKNVLRFRRYVWCTFSFFINKNAKIKTWIYNFSNHWIITFYKNCLASPSTIVEKQQNYTMM